ncbi:FAD-dependent monooxygenase [Paraburkholderia youngii]|uniref:FAD-dependent monooxygenase n=1 Tax=Paraburkholderia youngii TaxID=2782701 RepID=UPI003D1F93A1
MLKITVELWPGGRDSGRRTIATAFIVNIFCGGDATHRHPPSSGLGLNTCVQDAFNLAWKLAYVLNGHAGEELLQTIATSVRPLRCVRRTRLPSRQGFEPASAALGRTDI